MRGRISSRVVTSLAAMLLLAGTVVAADPSADPSASAGSSSEASSPESTESPSVEPSDAASLEPSESAAPLASSEPSSSAEPSASEAPGGAFSPDASEAPDKAETPEAPPTEAEIDDLVGRLKAAGITTTAAEFKALAAKIGVGGAVRTLAFAQASGKTPDQIVAMREGGKGWGQIVHELGLSIGPGIGWIMSGGHSSP